MTISLDSPILESLQYDDLLSYLENIDCERYDTENQKWIVFQCSHDIYGKPIEIVIPQNRNVSDINVHLMNAVNILSAVYDKSPEEIVSNIHYVDRDVLRIRNPMSGGLDSISLSVAAKQVSELKNLVAYAACSEQSPEAYFLRSDTTLARNAVSSYQFGHTFKGSFGFTIESPPISPNTFSTQKPLLDDTDDMPFSPVARRVMKRIVRGLSLTAKATREHDPRLIVDNYATGFNANMCTAIVNMSLDKKLPLEFSVAWSSLIPPKDEEISDPGIITLKPESYHQLEYAAEILTEYEPKKVSIHGLVTRLTANDNPLGLDTSRSIVLQWNNEAEGRVYRVYIVLDRDDYLKAIHAHESWLAVKITGELIKIKSKWHIVEYESFEVVQEE